MEKLIKKELPEFFKMCNERNGPDTIILTQEAFSLNEAILLGVAVKYAGKKNKIITIIP